jgi:hypothetical protein
MRPHDCRRPPARCSRALLHAAAAGVAALLALPAAGADGPLSPAEQRAILEKTLTVHLQAPEGLSAPEQETIRHLIAVGGLLQRIYEDSRHPQALAARESLGAPASDPATLYRLFQGPIATTLDNQRRPFVPVAAETPNRNIYPAGITAAEIEAFLARRPGLRPEILGERTVVRRATAESLDRDLAALARHPGIGALQPGLAERLRGQARDAGVLYAVPYSLAWADELVVAQGRLFEAAAAIEPQDAELARYLRNRGRDLLSNDYESGDASWVTGRFGRLNALVGAYETYDDALFGVKAFHAVSILARDAAATEELAKTLLGLQEVESALPYADPGEARRVRGDVPVGVYDVVADFGQARGTNTATILPNDALFSRRYGRTILMRKNIMLHPELAAIAERRWVAAVAPALAGRLAPEGGFQRTLWHEVGHYLGPDRTRDGRPLGQALRSWADTLEEMKADLVSLFAHERFRAAGRIGPERQRAVRASGILRTLQDNRPRRDQPYQTMQLAQFNWFLDRGLLQVDAAGRLLLDEDRYPEAVASLLREVMALQGAGDPARAEAFFGRWTAWTDDLHEAIAKRMREAGGPRFRLVRYGALGE